MKKLAIIIGCMLFVFSSNIYAVWVYTPKDGKWTNPKNDSKTTPRDQFIHASELEKDKKYDSAAREYKKLVKTFPTSNLISDALFKAAECYEKDNDYYRAYLTYQELIEKDPAFKNYEEIVNRQFKIGNLFLSGKKRKFWKFSVLPGTEQAIQIFEKVIENMPFSSIAAQAQLNIGLAHEEMKEYKEAIDAYKKVLLVYPDTYEAENALFRSGICAFTQSYGAEYDSSAAQESLKTFQRFLEVYPESELASDARMKIVEIQEREAKGGYRIGLFYEKAEDMDAAKVYYRDVITQYPDTVYAKKAKKRLDKIEKN